MSDGKRFTVVGAGSGGQAIAGDLSARGCEVLLYDVDEQKVRELARRGCVSLEGAIRVDGTITGATTDPREAASFGDVMFVVTTADAHEAVMEAVFPFLREGQIVVFVPGNWGALRARRYLERVRPELKITVAEAESLFYACEATSPGQVVVDGIKKAVGVAALPARETGIVVETLRDYYTGIFRAPSTLAVSLSNINTLFHPAIMICSASRIDGLGEFFFYREGVTPGVERLILRLDQERLALGRALGVSLPTVDELLHRFYDTEPGLLEGMRRNPAYVNSKAPSSLAHRYLTEDVPFGLVPLASLAGVVGTPANVATSLVWLASALAGVDFWQIGLTAHDLGLDQGSQLGSWLAYFG